MRNSEGCLISTLDSPHLQGTSYNLGFPATASENEPADDSQQRFGNGDGQKHTVWTQVCLSCKPVGHGYL